jgi:flagellar biosynthesis/type III secretory pathway M-ring protein FliF/YscJ
MTTLIIIALFVVGLIVWLVFLLKPKTKRNKKKSEDQKKEPKKKEPRKKELPRDPEDAELAKKMDEFVVMNPKYTTELVRSWLNQTRKRP